MASLLKKIKTIIPKSEVIHPIFHCCLKGPDHLLLLREMDRKGSSSQDQRSLAEDMMGKCPSVPSPSFFSSKERLHSLIFPQEEQKDLQSSVCEGERGIGKSQCEGRKEAASPACTCSCPPLGRSSPLSDCQHD